jgi:hypothetical protein
LATVTVPSGGATTLTFAGIPTGYKHLQIRGFSTYNTAVDSNRLRFNSDTGSNYSEHGLEGNGATASAFGSANTTSINVDHIVSGNAYYTATIIDILDYADTSKYKTVRSLGGVDKNGSGYVTLYSGSWRNTSAVSSVTLFPSAGTWTQYSTFALYGAK